MRHLLALVAGAAAVAATEEAPIGASPVACRISQNGGTYDVNYLANPTADWTWNDPFNMETMNYSYTFNICQTTVGKPTACMGVPGPWAAYQVVNATPTTQTCLAVGDLGYTLMSLYDPLDPSAGAVLTYKNGNILPGTNCKTSFSIAFQCGDFPFPSPVGPYQRNMHFVETTNVCQYTAYAMSQAGCPLECPIVNGAVCSGKGVCGYDKNVMAARCFCDDGYDEVDCNTPLNPFPTGTVAGTTIGGMIVGAAGVFGWAFVAAKRAGFGAPSVEGFYGQM